MLPTGCSVKIVPGPQLIPNPNPGNPGTDRLRSVHSQSLPALPGNATALRTCVTSTQLLQRGEILGARLGNVLPVDASVHAARRRGRILFDVGVRLSSSSTFDEDQVPHRPENMTKASYSGKSVDQCNCLSVRLMRYKRAKHF